MANKPDTNQLLEKLTQNENAKERLEKKQRLWESYKEELNYLHRQEQEALDEVAHFSKGTVSYKNATHQLEDFLEEGREIKNLSLEIEDTFEQEKKTLIEEEDRLTEAYYKSKSEEESNG
ncbi:hypothetical protein [uncultured Vagococcus sp.]|uniref:hypothetical protein n=1 Tax=uncultured Vagococcus sp. TaxID=189676 RepID=UPI0028D4027E|nr:hypothetical protein [uncultured Vagococcus sp.]